MKLINKISKNINRQNVLKEMLFGSNAAKWLNLNRGLEQGSSWRNKCIIRGGIFELFGDLN